MKRSILFVCVENSGRSQMAEGFARALGGGFWQAFSAGSRPSGKVNPLAVHAMKEAGIDISGARSKGFSDLPQLSWDTVVTMGCGERCPIIPSGETIAWELPDPKGKDLDAVRKIRDDVRGRLVSLLHHSKNE